MASKTFTAGEVSACCTTPENWQIIERRGDFTVRQCAVCQRKHYVLRAEPAMSSATPTDL